VAVWKHLGERVDHGTLVKIYGAPTEAERRKY
jgi:hypothetical protein